MAEHTRGQDGQPEKERRYPREDQKSNLGSEHQISTNRGISDMDAQPSVGNRGRTRGSGIVTKKNITGSDYDGQLSDE